MWNTKSYRPWYKDEKWGIWAINIVTRMGSSTTNSSCISLTTGILKNKILELFHNSHTGGHLGYDKTLHRVKREFFWPSWNFEIKEYIRGCVMCHQVKNENTFFGVLQQCIPLPFRLWTNKWERFYWGTFPSQGFSCLWVIVDRYTIFFHFIPSLIHT